MGRYPGNSSGQPVLRWSRLAGSATQSLDLAPTEPSNLRSGTECGSCRLSDKSTASARRGVAGTGRSIWRSQAGPPIFRNHLLEQVKQRLEVVYGRAEKVRVWHVVHQRSATRSG